MDGMGFDKTSTSPPGTPAPNTSTFWRNASQFNGQRDQRLKDDKRQNAIMRELERDYSLQQIGAEHQDRVAKH